MAVSNAQIVEFLLANPGMSDADIAAVMRTYGVDPSQVAEATGSDVAAIQERFDAVAPAAPEPVDEPVAEPVAPAPVAPVAEVAPVAPVAKTSTENVIDFLVSNPNASDAEIVESMKTFGVSPAQLATATGTKEGAIAARVAATVSPGSSVTLGDTVIVPQYRTTGSGMDEQVLGLEGFASSKTTGDPNYKAPVGTPMQIYSADGEFVDTVKTKKDQSFFGGLVSALKDPVVLAAIGAVTAGATGLFSGAPAAGTAFAGEALADAALLSSGGAASAAVPFAGEALADAGLLSGGAAGAATGGAAALTPTATAPTVAGATAPTVAGTGIKAGTALAGTGVLTGSTLGTSAAAGGLLTTAATKAAESVIGKAITGGLTTAGGLVQAQVSKEAAQAAQKKIDDETAAAKTAAQFRPVGMTTRFGSSQFAFDPKTGQLTSAGYTLSPEAKAAQDRFVKLAESGITQAEGAQKAFEPLQTGAQSLFTLGNKYLAQTPEQVAQDYLKSQMALLQPGREIELANLQNKLQQQGRGGLSVAMGGTLGATTPELQALYNARAQQEAILAANAQREGQQNVLFGAGLLGTGASTMGQYYGGQQAAYSPYTSAINQVKDLETAGQQPLTTGINLGNLVSTAGARVGDIGLKGAGLSTALATGAAATNSPLATALTGLGSSGLLTTGINTAIDAFSSNQLNPSSDLGLSVVGPAQAAALTGPMNVNTADMARGLGIKLPTNYAGTTTTVNPLAPNQQYTY